MASVAQISDEERAIAIKATQTLGLDVAGVDILRATRGPLVSAEVRDNPGIYPPADVRAKLFTLKVQDPKICLLYTSRCV